MKARFRDLIAEGRWIAGLSVYAGMGAVWLAYVVTQ